MQYVSLRINAEEDQELYRTFHIRNADYLERELEPDKFQVLWYIDDSSPTFIKDKSSLIKLMHDLELVIKEASLKNDIEMSNHLKEIFVLCKMCLWKENNHLKLIFSPFGFQSDDYSLDIPERYRFNISALD